MKTEGWHLLAPFFPFLYDVILIKVEKVNLDLEFQDVRTRSRLESKRSPRAGGELTINVSLTYIPDYKSNNAGVRLIEFLNSGGEEGIRNILRDLIAEDIREMGAVYDWEEFTFSRGELMKNLVQKLIGKEFTGEVQKELQSNGLPDVMDLGIKISRFNVVRIKAQGELARVAEMRVKEEQEKRGEEIELDFIMKKADELKKGRDLSDAEVFNIIQTERGKAKKDIRAYEGIDRTADSFGRGLAEIFKKKR